MLQKLKNYYHLLQSFIFNARYGFPARKLKIIGVTGTDGKTTTTSMIYHVLKSNGFRVGMISTIMAKLDEEELDTGLHVTTPEPWDLPRVLRLMVDKGIEYVVIESTSSGLDQNRLFGVNYDSSTITNIGHDHIDYHKTWDNYANAKFKMIKKTNKNGLVVLNKDHESAEWLKNKCLKFNVNPQWYSIEQLINKEHSVNGIEFEYKNQKFKLPLIGEYNFSNALGVIKLCERYLELEKISNALETFNAPLGRMQVMQNSPFTVIIDFAHTPSSLERALESVNKIRPNANAKLITVFGCAGERDPERRKMGAVSAKLADVTIVTLEDPRSEDIEVINDQIIKYAEEKGVDSIKRFKSHEEYIREKEFQPEAGPPLVERIKNKVINKSIFSFDYPNMDNRKNAIEFAINLANEDDIVFITGKGHEQSLGIGNPTIEYPYTDQETVEMLLH